MLQRFQNARHRDHHRNAIVMTQSHQRPWTYLAAEYDRTFEKSRYKETHRLTEHVTQWKQFKNPDWLKDCSPSLVLRDFSFKAIEVRADIAMPMHDAVRFSGGSRRIDDFHNVIRTRW